MPDETPALDELADDEDELDATGIDYKADPVPDDELWLVALGGTKEKVEAYRAWFAVDDGDDS